MTYQQLYESLQSELKEKADIYFNMEKKLCKSKSWADIGDLGDYKKAKIEWKTASTNYWNFLSDVKSKAVDPDEEIYFGLNN